MHSIIKNLSKVLALAVLSTIFSPSFVSANKTKHNSESLHTTAEPVDAISADEMSEDERLFREQIDRFMELGQGRFVVADDFKTQDNYHNAYLMLKQLNDLFDRYHKVLTALIAYAKDHGRFYLCKVSPTAHEVIVPPHPWSPRPLPIDPATTEGVTDPCARFMLFNAPTLLRQAIITLDSITGLSARVDDDKYLQAIVSNMFGKLMSFLKCLTDYYYFTSDTSTTITPQAADLLQAICDAHLQKTRDAVNDKYGKAPYISHRANAVLPAAPLPDGAELTDSALPKVTCNYFAELFSYTECNSQAPADLKKAVSEIINKWFA